MWGPRTCPAGTGAFPYFSLVKVPGRSSSSVAPGKPLLPSLDALACLWLLMFPVPALGVAEILRLSREMSVWFSTEVPRNLSPLSRDFKVQLIKALRSTSEWPLLSRRALTRGVSKVLSVVVLRARFGSMEVLIGECKGKWWNSLGSGLRWRMVENTGGWGWGEEGMKSKDKKNGELQMRQPFSLFNDHLTLLEPVAIWARLAC